jgi:hypothetical protein
VRKLILAEPQRGSAQDPKTSEEYVKVEAAKLSALHLTPGCDTLRRLALLWAAKAVVGSVLETLILRDREQFLKEACPGARCWLAPLFNPTLSPRFVAVVALK